MTKSRDVPTQLAPNEVPPKEVKAPIASRNKFNRDYKLYLTILTLLALGSALCALILSLQLRQTTAAEVTTTLNALNMLKQQQVESKTAMDSTMQTFQQAHLELQKKLTTVDNNLQSAMQEHRYQAQDWLLLKARYYLELAQINAHWGDLPTTIMLLQQADDLLAKIHDQRLFTVRQAIAKELTLLKAMPTVDVTGLLSQLDAAQTAISHLKTKPVTLPNTEDKTPDEKTPSQWRTHFQNTLNTLEKIVVIRRHQENVEPLISQEQEAVLRERIRLNLEEAKWSVLLRNDAVYQLALSQTISTIKRSFALSDHATQGLLEQLQTLQKTPIGQEKPDVGQSLPLLNQVIESNNTKNPGMAAGENS